MLNRPTVQQPKPALGRKGKQPRDRRRLLFEANCPRQLVECQALHFQVGPSFHVRRVNIKFCLSLISALAPWGDHASTVLGPANHDSKFPDSVRIRSALGEEVGENFGDFIHTRHIVCLLKKPAQDATELVGLCMD